MKNPTSFTTALGLALLLGACGKSIAPIAEQQATAPLPTPVAASPAARQKHATRYAADEARRLAAPAVMGSIPQAAARADRDRYAELDANGVKRVAEEPVSTFSVDVDTGAYAIVRRHLNEGRLPPGNAVRTEELINYFTYDYPAPTSRDEPFSVVTEVAPAPWNEHTHLVQIGVRGFTAPDEKRPPANLVFLVDVSGSMHAANKLPLLKRAFRLLVDRLGADDRVSLVVYAGASGVVLEPTPGDRKATILAALDGLSAGGSTHGSAGIELAYAMAAQARITGGINRVVLATDGDFNVGTVNHQALLDLIAQKKTAGIQLTTLGFGAGNYNDHLMEQLADHGDGNYAYIDSLNEARKVLVEELASTLEVIASDVKIQVEWNPARVSEYRLVGYENRILRREDFSNDKVDAGDIGAGHTVTALYEVTFADSPRQRIQPLRYSHASGAMTERGRLHEIAHVRLRFKHPGEKQSRLLTRVIDDSAVATRFEAASDDLRFAAAVAGYAERLRGGQQLGNLGYADILAIAREARGRDERGYRGEFLGLVGLSQALDPRG